MAKIKILIIFLLLPFVVRSQEDVCIGKEYSIFSETLNEERSFWVHLPEKYMEFSDRSYSVIYLLDGDMYFHALVGFVNAYSKGRGANKDEYIIVGVLNTDRTRDFTLTATTRGRDGKLGFFDKPQGGGSEQFLSFLKKELKEEINKTYRTNKQNILIGHSYAGLFTLDTFLRHHDEFEVYIAIDPSLWWDGGRLVDEARTMLSKNDFEGKSLYLGFASQKRSDRVDIHLEKANYFIEEVLPQAKNLYFKYKLFPEETHGTIAIPGIYDGFKQLLKR